MKEERRMENMKRQYQEIPVPEALKGRLEETIRQANMETEREETTIKKSNIIKYVRRTASAAAAAVLILTIGVNTSPTVAYAFEGIPVIGALTKLVTFREYEVQRGNMEADIVTPQVEGLENKDTEEKLNQELIDYTDTLIQQFEADLEDMGEGHEGGTTSYEILTDNDRIFSMAVHVTKIQASSMQENLFYTVDKSTGKILELKDLFVEGSDYQTVLTAEIQRQMREQMADDSGKSYFLDSQPASENDFTELKEDAKFTITEEGKLIIAFDEYEVAAGYMGAPQFEIPTEAVKDILPEDSLLR